MTDPSSLLDLRTIVSVGIPALVAVIGWFFGHWLNSRREQVTRRREARIKAIEKAYLRLAGSSNRPLNDDVINDLETFVAELQLYGTPDQLLLMQRLVDQFIHPTSDGRVDFDPLLIALRDSLRTELQLERVEGAVWWLRIAKGSPRELAPVGSVASSSPSIERPDA